MPKERKGTRPTRSAFRSASSRTFKAERFMTMSPATKAGVWALAVPETDNTKPATNSRRADDLSIRRCEIRVSNAPPILPYHRQAAEGQISTVEFLISPIRVSSERAGMVSSRGFGEPFFQLRLGEQAGARAHLLDNRLKGKRRPC